MKSDLEKENARLKGLLVESKRQLEATVVAFNNLHRYYKNQQEFIKDIKAMIPANYPYKSSCSSFFCKIITALRNRGLE